MNSLENQLRSYYEHIDDVQEPVGTDDVFAIGEPVRPVPSMQVRNGRRKPITGLVVLAVGVAVLVAGGLTTLLLQGESIAPSDDTVASTVATPTVTTATVIVTPPTDPVEKPVDREWGDYEVTELTVAFTPASVPDDVQCPGQDPTTGSSDPYLPYVGSWFGGTCYVIPADGLLYRTIDGNTWESAAAADMLDRIVAADQALMSLTIEPLESSHASPACGQTPAALVIGQTTDVESWTFTRIPLPVPDPGFAVACTQLERPMLTTGPKGLLLMSGLRHELDVEAIISATLGEDVVRTMTQLTMTATTIEIITQSGESVSLDLRATDYWDEITLFSESLGDEAPDTTMGAFDSAVPIGWWSPDGIRWVPVARQGPMLNEHIEEVVAIDSGFLVASIGMESDDIEQGIMWFTADGSNWSQRQSSASTDDETAEATATTTDLGTLTWIEADQGIEYGPEGRRSAALGGPVDAEMVRNLYAAFGPNQGDLGPEPRPGGGSYTDGDITLIPVHLAASDSGGLLVSPGQGDDNWQWVPGPWRSENYDYYMHPFAVVPDGGFMASVASETLIGGDLLTTYLSTDGVTWENVGEPPYLSGVERYTDVLVYPFADRLRADVQLTERYADIESWETTDGVAWSPARSFEGGRIETFATDFGWIGITWLYDGGYGIWASQDAETWQRLPPPEGFNELRIDGTWTPDAGGNTVSLTIEGESETRTWIGTLTP